MVNQKTCPCCGGRKLESYCKIGEYRILKCSACGSGFTFPRIRGETLSKFYRNEYYSERPLFPIINRLLNLNRISQIQKYKGSGRVLDLGCGDGKFSAAFDKRFWEVSGLDISKEACQLTGRYIKDVFCGNLYQAHYPDDYFDLVTANHTLEHFADFPEILSEVKRILKPNGYFYVEVPNFQSLGTLLLKGEWPTINDLPRHMNHFSEAGLIYLTSGNFEIVKRTNNFFYDIFFLFFLTRLYISRKTKNRVVGIISAIILSPMLVASTFLKRSETINILFKVRESGGG